MSLQWVMWQFRVFPTPVSVQPFSVHGAHGHACTHTLCHGHQGAEPHLGGPGGWQADHCRCGQAGGGKELATELHRSEPGGVTTHGISLVGPPSGSLTNPPAAPARPTGVQHRIQLLQTLTPSLCYLQIWHIQIKLWSWARHHRLIFQNTTVKGNQLSGYTSYFHLDIFGICAVLDVYHYDLWQTPLNCHYGIY